jgi:hypothetical protein
MTAQLPTPITIAKTYTAAAKGSRRAIVELIVDAAVVGAIRAATEKIDHAMIAKTRRQR